MHQEEPWKDVFPAKADRSMPSSLLVFLAAVVSLMTLLPLSAWWADRAMSANLVPWCELSGIRNRGRVAPSSSRRTACTMQTAGPSSPSASSRPSKPAPAPPRWLTASMEPTYTTTGTRSSPDAFRSSRARGRRVVVACPDGLRRPRKSSPKILHPNAPARTRRLLR